jgi:hypothetical protein
MILALNIGEERTTLALELPGHRVDMAIGWKDIVRRYFKHQPPTPLDLEAAIEAVEDEIMRVRHQVPSESTVETADAAIRDIGLAAGVAPSDDMTLALEAVEQSFQRLTKGGADMPDHPRFSSTLLILRELMHHLAFRQIRIKS